MFDAIGDDGDERFSLHDLTTPGEVSSVFLWFHLVRQLCIGTGSQEVHMKLLAAFESAVEWLRHLECFFLSNSAPRAARPRASLAAPYLLYLSLLCLRTTHVLGPAGSFWVNAPNPVDKDGNRIAPQ